MSQHSLFVSHLSTSSLALTRPTSLTKTKDVLPNSSLILDKWDELDRRYQDVLLKFPDNKDLNKIYEELNPQIQKLRDEREKYFKIETPSAVLTKYIESDSIVDHEKLQQLQLQLEQAELRVEPVKR